MREAMQMRDDYRDVKAEVVRMTEQAADPVGAERVVNGMRRTRVR